MLFCICYWFHVEIWSECKFVFLLLLFILFFSLLYLFVLHYLYVRKFVHVRELFSVDINDHCCASKVHDFIEFL